MKIKISVIIPVYNVEKFLPQCFDSIINQTFKDFECIIINDGSSDNSLKIMKEYALKDKKIKIINQKNIGAGLTRNKGIKEAKGEYLYFIDSDDYIKNNTLKTLFDLANKYNADIVCFEPYYIKKGYKIKEITKLSEVSTVVWDKLYKKELIIKNNIIFENLKSCNDITFNYIAASLANKIIKINKIFYYYNTNNPNQISASRGKNCFCLYSALNVLKSNLIKNNLLSKFKKDFNILFLSCFKYELSKIEDDKLKEKFIEQLKKENLIVYKQIKEIRKYPNWLVKFISCCIPSKKLRHKVRNYLR